ncbi:hypothetical protein [Chthonobacter rhizosphaerae]|uniref:hypothetical protein n=1 Tax=Chthonobacter rhizosphaerae TaxID=2735553 RepID=UPI0015EE6AF5|nr:hypothetical protein [Chthonobacter rhizosphaerae]
MSTNPVEAEAAYRKTFVDIARSRLALLISIDAPEATLDRERRLLALAEQLLAEVTPTAQAA